MDVITWPYRSQMAMYADRPDYLVWGQWQFCQPTAEPVPFLVEFNSSFLHDDSFFEEGCRERKQRWIRDPLDRDPVSSALPGDHVCGTEEEWRSGVYADRGGLEVDANGIPECCGGAEPKQGEVDGDASEQEVAFHQEQFEGEKDSEEGTQPMGYLLGETLTPAGAHFEDIWSTANDGGALVEGEADVEVFEE